MGITAALLVLWRVFLLLTQDNPTNTQQNVKHQLSVHVPSPTVIEGPPRSTIVTACDGVRRRRLLRRLLRRKITSRYQTFDVEGAQAPPAAIYWRGFNKGWLDKGWSYVVSDWIGRDRHD